MTDKPLFHLKGSPIYKGDVIEVSNEPDFRTYKKIKILEYYPGAEYPYLGDFGGHDIVSMYARLPAIDPTTVVAEEPNAESWEDLMHLSLPELVAKRNGLLHKLQETQRQKMQVIANIMSLRGLLKKETM